MYRRQPFFSADALVTRWTNNIASYWQHSFTYPSDLTFSGDGIEYAFKNALPAHIHAVEPLQIELEVVCVPSVTVWLHES